MCEALGRMPGATTKYRNWTKRQINMGGFFKSKQKLGIILLHWQKHICSKTIKRMEPGSTQVPGRAPDNGWPHAGHVPCCASRGLRFPGAGVTGQLSWMLGTERCARFLRHLIYACVYIYVPAMAWLWESEENTVEPGSPSTMEAQQWNSGFRQQQAAFLAEPSLWLLAIIY